MIHSAVCLPIFRLVESRIFLKQIASSHSAVEDLKRVLCSYARFLATFCQRTRAVFGATKFFEAQRFSPVFVEIYKPSWRKVAKSKKGCQTLIQVAVKDRYQLGPKARDQRKDQETKNHSGREQGCSETY